MPTKYTVKLGDSLSSIAKETGFVPDKIWKLDDNKSLSDDRSDPEVLHEGDELYIPDKKTKEVELATGDTYKFRRLGFPAKFTLYLSEDGEAIADEPYALIIDGFSPIEGRTTTEGAVVAYVQPQVETAKLVIGRETIEIYFGHLAPISELLGVQQRLFNLGFFTGEVDGETSSELEAAVQKFQTVFEMDVTGEIDDTLRSKLAEIHDPK